VWCWEVVVLQASWETEDDGETTWVEYEGETKQVEYAGETKQVEYAVYQVVFLSMGPYCRCGQIQL